MGAEDDGTPSPERGGVPVEVKQQLLDKISPALEGLVEADKRPEVISRLLTVLQARVSVKQMQVTETVHQGTLPLPPPEMMERYEALHPGMTDRLLRLVEQAQAAEIASANDVNGRTDRYQLLALGAGFVGLLVVLGVAYALAEKGHDWVAGGVLGIGVSGIIATLVNAPFLKGRGRLDEADNVPSAPKEKGE